MYIFRFKKKEEVSHSLGAEALAAMSWKDFVTRFRAEFSTAIKVKQLAREV